MRSSRIRRWLFTVGLAGSIEGYVPLAAEKEEAASMTSPPQSFCDEHSSGLQLFFESLSVDIVRKIV